MANLSSIINIFLYVGVIALFLLGNVWLWCLYGAVAFGAMVGYLIFVKKRLSFPSSIPVLFGFLCLLVSLIIWGEDVFFYSGSFFYGSFALVFSASVLLKHPYTYIYFTKGGKYTERQKRHYLYSSLWLILYLLSLFFSLALIPGIWYILLPILLMMFGFLFINFILRRIIGFQKELLIDGENIFSSVEESLQKMVSLFQPEAVKGWNFVIQYTIKGEGGGNWHVEILDGKCALHAKKHKNPNLKISFKVDDWLLIANGKITGEKAYLSGKLKAEGDTEILVQLGEIFNTEKIA